MADAEIAMVVRLGRTTIGLVASLSISLALISPGAVRAQAEPEAVTALRTCAQIERERERLACFEQAAASLDNAATTAPADTARSDSTASTDAAIQKTAPRSETTAAPRAADGRNHERDAGAQTVVIAEVTTSEILGTSFRTADGRTFVQTSANRGRFPPVPFEAVLQEAAQDSFFLVSPLGGPRVRVSLARFAR